MQTFFWLITQSSLNKWQEEMCDEALRMSVWEAEDKPELKFFFQALHNRGGSRIFFRRGHTCLLLYFNANKPHSFFFCRISVVLENRRSSQGGAHPLHPPPRSTPDKILTICRQRGRWQIRRRPKIIQWKRPPVVLIHSWILPNPQMRVWQGLRSTLRLAELPSWNIIGIIIFFTNFYLYWQRSGHCIQVRLAWLWHCCQLFG